MVVAASGLTLLLCIAPILAVDERRYARGTPSDLTLTRAVAETLRNRPFCLYLVAQLLFVFGVNLIQPAMPYFATVVLGRSEGFAFTLGLALLAGSAVGFAAVGALVRRIGPKRAMMLCIGIFAVAMGSLGFLEADVPGGPRDARNLAIVFGAIGAIGIPVAGMLILPYVLISQVIDYDERRTGANRSAMYFGVQGFFTKWVYGVSLWAITFLLSRFGNSPAEPLGVILIGPVAGGACLLAVALYTLYPEREILRAAQRG